MNSLETKKIKPSPTNTQVKYAPEHVISISSLEFIQSWKSEHDNL